MLKRLQMLILAAIAFGFAANTSHAEEPLLEGVRSFICDEQPFILVENDKGWRLAESPELRVQETRNGWQLGDQGMGFIAYLREKERGKWIIENLAEDGYEKLDCINITESLSGVVTIIKRWSQDFRPVVKVDQLVKEMTQNDETKEPLA